MSISHAWIVHRIHALTILANTSTAKRKQVDLVCNSIHYNVVCPPSLRYNCFITLISLCAYNENYMISVGFYWVSNTFRRRLLLFLPPLSTPSLCLLPNSFRLLFFFFFFHSFLRHYMLLTIFIITGQQKIAHSKVWENAMFLFAFEEIKKNTSRTVWQKRFFLRIDTDTGKFVNALLLWVTSENMTRISTFDIFVQRGRELEKKRLIALQVFQLIDFLLAHFWYSLYQVQN